MGAGGGRRFRIFDLSTGRVKASYDARDTVHGMSFAEDDSVVALGLAEGVCALNVALRAGMKDGEVPPRAAWGPFRCARNTRRATLPPTLLMLFHLLLRALQASELYILTKSSSFSKHAETLLQRCY